MGFPRHSMYKSVVVVARATNITRYSSLNSLPNGIEKIEPKIQSCLSADGIMEKYDEAVKLYSRFKNAAVIETECSVKAVRVLILQEKFLEAANFLQNMIFIALQISEDEKIERFSVLSDLYSQIGFHRKAAFFKRVSAMRCVAPQNETPNWSRCYHLILQTLKGYKLSLDPREFQKDITYGWPGLQIQVLQELVGTARRMGNSSLSVRHMTFLLHTMFDYVSKSDRKEFASQLETLTNKCEGAPVILALEDTGLIIPPVNLTYLPRVKSFKLQKLAPHLRPIKMLSDHTGILKEPKNSGPFIFSPIQMNRDKSSKDNTKMDFQWVQGDVCEVSLRVFNPMPFELKVNPMGLMADGIAFETFPACLSLPPESGPYPVNLLGTPRSNGELIILANFVPLDIILTSKIINERCYTTHVLGVKSNCKLKDLPVIQKPHYSINVVPALPQVEVCTSLPKSATFSSLADSGSHVVTSASISLFAGQSHDCVVTLTGSGCEKIEKINFFIQTKLDKEMEKNVFTWNMDDLQSQLPISPKCSASSTLKINAFSDFVCHSKPKSKPNSQRNTPTHRRTSDSAQKHAHSEVLGSSSEALQMHMIEALLEIQYSGGPGMHADYCRQCAIAINVEIIPSLVITKWDVLPAETPGHCYLVLDILNTTAHEMEVLYTNTKRMLIEAHETCRVPVPIERCPLAKFNSAPECSEDVCREYMHTASFFLFGIICFQQCTAYLLTITKDIIEVISGVEYEKLLLENDCYKPENEPSYTVGELVNISIIIHNQSDKSLRSLLMTVQGYQDYQNGNHNYCLDHKRAIVGADQAIIEEVLVLDLYS
ncbi:Protein brunelleschi [Nymphon striatum]|nr:Protein brunelleschi [Nymphon striatum]